MITISLSINKKNKKEIKIQTHTNVGERKIIKLMILVFRMENGGKICLIWPLEIVKGCGLFKNLTLLEVTTLQ